MGKNKILSERIKQLREKKGLTQYQLAEILGIKNQTVSNYESGEREPSYNILLKLSDCFGVTTDYLFGRTDIEKNIMPKISEDLTEIWETCSGNEQLSLIFKDMLEIMKYLKYSYELYDLPDAVNEFVSESRSLFFDFNKFYNHITHEVFSAGGGAYIKDLIKIAEFYVTGINSRFNELMWLPFEINDSTLDEPISEKDIESFSKDIVHFELEGKAAAELLKKMQKQAKLQDEKSSLAIEKILQKYMQEKEVE